MIKQSTAAAGLGYQGELFKLDPVIKKATKPAPERSAPLEVLSLQFGDVKATARKYIVAKEPLYHVVFSDNRKPLVVTLASKFNGKDFWTSIPEGRQKEAEEIGKLIDNLLN